MPLPLPELDCEDLGNFLVFLSSFRWGFFHTWVPNQFLAWLFSSGCEHREMGHRGEKRTLFSPHFTSSSQISQCPPGPRVPQELRCGGEGRRQDRSRASQSCCTGLLGYLAGEQLLAIAAPCQVSPSVSPVVPCSCSCWNCDRWVWAAVAVLSGSFWEVL